MLSLNVPKKYIADYVGHETENMIDQVYGHIMASKKSSVQDQLQSYFSGVFSKNWNEIWNAEKNIYPTMDFRT